MSDDLSNEDIEKLIKEALQIKVAEGKELKSRTETLKQVTGVMSEYLDSFFVLGFDMKGRPVINFFARTEQQQEALNSLLTKYFYSNMVYYDQ